MDGSHIQLWKELIERLLLGLALAVVLLPGTALGDKVNAEWYSSVRALSMGNTGISQSDDPQTSMFYNPALLATQRKTNFEFFNPQIENGFGNLALANETAHYTSQLNLGSAYPLLLDEKNTPSSFSASIYPNFYAQNFALGLLGKAESSSYVNENGRLIYRSRYLVMPTMALSAGLFSGRLRFGVAVRLINSTQNDKNVANADDEGYIVNAQEGLGVGLDAGMTIGLPWKLLPTFGLVARNVGDTSFSSDAIVKVSKGNPIKHDMVKKTYDAGFSIAPKLTQRSGLVMALDYRDATNTSNTPTLRKVNLGFEITSYKVFQLRFGVSRGFWTAGFGLRGKSSSLDIGSYADELDASGFRKVEDRRLAIRYGGHF